MKYCLWPANLKMVIMIIVIYYAPLTLAQSVVVVPLFDSASNLQNIVTVAKKHGDFTDPIAAMASITNAGRNNRYLIVIGPGEYNLGTNQLIMKEYVSVQGAGLSITKLSGAVHASCFTLRESALVVGAQGTELSDLSIENTGFGTNCSIGYYVLDDNVSVNNVSATANGSTQGSYGFYISGTSGGFFKDIFAIAQGGSFSNIGIDISNGTTRFNRALAIGIGGFFSYGIIIRESNAQFSDIEGIAAGASNNDAGLRTIDSEPTIRNSKIVGLFNGLWVDGVDAAADGPHISNTQIEGGVMKTPAAISYECFGNYDEDLNAVGC